MQFVAKTVGGKRTVAGVHWGEYRAIQLRSVFM